MHPVAIAEVGFLFGPEAAPFGALVGGILGTAGVELVFPNNTAVGQYIGGKLEELNPISSM